MKTSFKSIFILAIFLVAIGIVIFMIYLQKQQGNNTLNNGSPTNGFDQEAVSEFQNIIPERALRDGINYTEKDIQNFLNTQDGILKSYKKTYTIRGEIREKTAAHFVAGASGGLGYTINPRILLVLLELKANAITDPNFNEQNLDYVLGVTDEEYATYSEEMQMATTKMITVKGEKAAGMDRQLEWMAQELDRSDGCFRTSDPCRLKIQFWDGTVMDEVPNLNSQTLALHRVLAHLAPDREIWELWVSRKPGSFYELYRRWFGSQ